MTSRDTSEESLTEILDRATEAINSGDVVAVPEHAVEDYAPVSGVPPEGREIHRKLTASGELLASYYERQASSVVEAAQRCHDELIGLAHAIREEANREASRASRFTQRVERLGSRAKAEWQDNPEGL